MYLFPIGGYCAQINGANRNGTDAMLIDPDTQETQAFYQIMDEWLKKTEKYKQALGYEKYMDTIRHMLRHGNSAKRQRRVFDTTRSPEAVTEHNVREWEEGVS